MSATLDELFEVLGALGEDGPLQATSMRLPKALHDALAIGIELGMDSSFSTATREALVERIRGFARQAASRAYFAAFPDDLPRLAEMAKRRVSGTEHPAAAERAAAGGGPVEILTSNSSDMAALAAQLAGLFEIRRL